MQKGNAIRRTKLFVPIRLFYKQGTDAPDLTTVPGGLTVEKLHRNSVVEDLKINCEPGHFFVPSTELDARLLIFARKLFLIVLCIWLTAFHER